ncbi:hypothetical protein JWG39_08775 [Desulforhopalus vacuolatus]|uniref:hypothetical protein n=1 Tax=Desulforhopalus vacuolatus TaxID=40414 RepID=UPI001963CA2B|nr:hypothetical protein [Desulforhopalus vacuolatus]MBM9519909.1 hypothetical protein [Desulforhopalus vacuolatus]
MKKPQYSETSTLQPPHTSFSQRHGVFTPHSQPAFDEPRQLQKHEPPASLPRFWRVLYASPLNLNELNQITPRFLQCLNQLESERYYFPINQCNISSHGETTHVFAAS